MYSLYQCSFVSLRHYEAQQNLLIVAQMSKWSQIPSYPVHFNVVLPIARVMKRVKGS